jgi:hypothetical protein
LSKNGAVRDLLQPILPLCYHAGYRYFLLRRIGSLALGE